jgi:hypothetical protein
LPPVFDLRLLPIAYGAGHVMGLFGALVRSILRGTRLRDEAEEVPIYAGLTIAGLYLAVWARGVL